MTNPKVYKYLTSNFDISFLNRSVYQYLNLELQWELKSTRLNRWLTNDLRTNPSTQFVSQISNRCSIPTTIWSCLPEEDSKTDTRVNTCRQLLCQIWVLTQEHLREATLRPRTLMIRRLNSAEEGKGLAVGITARTRDVHGRICLIKNRES